MNKALIDLINCHGWYDKQDLQFAKFDERKPLIGISNTPKSHSGCAK